jgi:hypothetical protein
MQCRNCQQIGHVWENCKQPPRCMRCGGGHLHKECPRKGNTSSTPTCCNCRLSKGEKPPNRQLSGLQTRVGGAAEKEVAEDTQDYNGKGVLFQPHHSRRVLRGGAPRQDRGTAGASDMGLRHIRWTWQVPPQWNPESLDPYPNTNTRQQVSQSVSQFGPLMQTVCLCTKY